MNFDNSFDMMYLLNRSPSPIYKVDKIEITYPITSVRSKFCEICTATKAYSEKNLNHNLKHFISFCILIDFGYFYYYE